MPQSRTPAGGIAATLVAILALSACSQPSAESSANATASVAPHSQEPTAMPAAPDRAAFEKITADWRAQRVQRLRKPDGWLSLVGLHWVEKGAHRIGSADGNDIQLHIGPAHLGRLTLAGGKALFTPDPATDVRIDGKPAGGEIELRSDATSDPRGPTIVAFAGGSANFQLIERAGKFALRVKDANAPTRTGFAGIDYFDPDPSWRVTARFQPHPHGQTLPIATVINTVEPMSNPGVVVFEKDGKTYRLEALDEGDGELFLIFADRTSGKTTYGAGRFLYADPPKNGATVVDFNQAYNPPCVFTHYATCPLPPAGNRLDIAVEAGEKKYRGSDAHAAAGSDGKSGTP